MVRNVQIIVLIQALVAAEQRSFRKASELLGVRTSTISRRIRELEERLGVAIFQRHRHGIRPTDAGAAFLDDARRIVSDLQSLVTNARAAGRGTTGRLRIGFYLSLSHGELRNSLLAYREHCPEIDVRIAETARHRLIERLNAGALDVVIISGRDPPPGLEILPLWYEKIFVGLPDAHDLASRKTLNWNDLDGAQFILPEHDPGPELRDIVLGRRSRSQTPSLLQLDIARDNVLNLVSFGCRFTLLYGADIGVSHGGVVYRELNDRALSRSALFVACWKQANTTPALVSFVELLRQRYAQNAAIAPTAPPLTARPTINGQGQTQHNPAVDVTRVKTQ